MTAIGKVYECLNLLPEPKRLINLDWRSIPDRGVYVFYSEEQPEPLSSTGRRIVRIGTHALKSGSKSKLSTRLKQHRGSVKTLNGNHRGSIFRLLVGQAILSQDASMEVPSWGVGSSLTAASNKLMVEREHLKHTELALEQRVSQFIQGLHVQLLDIGDEPSPESLRGYFERNLIAALSEANRNGLVSPTEDWLGHISNRPLVRESGLWNQRHVSDPSDEGFVARLNSLIQN